jgi:hypothetical protein
MEKWPFLSYRLSAGGCGLKLEDFADIVQTQFGPLVVRVDFQRF